MLTEILDDIGRPIAETLQVPTQSISVLGGSAAIGVGSNFALDMFTRGITPILKLVAGGASITAPLYTDVDSRTRDELMVIGSILTTQGLLDIARNAQNTITSTQDFITKLSQGRIQEAFSSIIINPFQGQLAGSLMTSQVTVPQTIVTTATPQEVIVTTEPIDSGRVLL